MTEGPASPTEGAAAPFSLHLVMRFVLAGGFNSLVHAAVFSLLVFASDGVRGGWLIAASWVIAMPAAYVVQSKLVWHKPLNLQGLVRLTVSYVPSFLVSTGLGFWIGSLGGSYFWQEVIGLGAAAGLGFVLQRHWVYRG